MIVLEDGGARPTYFCEHCQDPIDKAVGGIYKWSACERRSGDLSRVYQQTCLRCTRGNLTKVEGIRTTVLPFTWAAYLVQSVACAREKPPATPSCLPPLASREATLPANRSSNS